MDKKEKIMDLLCQAMMPTCEANCIQEDILYCSTCHTIADYFDKRGIIISFPKTKDKVGNN